MMKKNVMLWVGAGQIGMAIARRMGYGMKIIVGDKKLENAVKELTDDDGENRFTIDELAVILDMNVDEIRDILRLTGDDK